jgi:DNA invertase Pin-like site-specific DNA recombinase
MTDNGEVKKLRVAVYIRISTQDQKANNTNLNQEEIIRRYVENRSETLEFAGDEYWYQDLWISWAAEVDERPALNRLFEDLEYFQDCDEKPFDLLVVYRLDRVARSPLLLLEEPWSEL